MNLKNLTYILSLKFITPLIIIINTISCDYNKGQELRITGKISGINKESIILEKISGKQIDTSFIKKTDGSGNFEIKVNTIIDGFYRLKTIDDNIIFLFLKKGDIINITASYPEIYKNYNVEGSPDSELLRLLYHKLIEYSDNAAEMRQEMIDAHFIPFYDIDSLRHDISLRASRMYMSAKEYLTGFIKANYKSPVIYMALYQYIDINPILTMDNDMNIFEFVLKNLKEYNPDLEQTGILENDISNYKLRKQQKERNYLNLKVGSEAPDFSLQNTQNERITLYKFKGKPVILYFWASWSTASTKNIPLLSNIKKNYSEKIEIITISLDSNPEKWKNSINSLGISNLTNVSDFKIWESPVTKIYSITILPTFVLVNGSGIIEIITNDADDFNKVLDQIDI